VNLKKRRKICDTKSGRKKGKKKKGEDG